MPPYPHDPSGPDGAPPARGRRLVPALGIFALVSAVIAAVVIVAGGGEPVRAEDPEAQVRLSDESLSVGPPDAPTKVVVFEDFASAASREFEIASRDFLEIAAAQGTALVEYRLFPVDDGYSRQAAHAWAAVLRKGSAEQAMAFHRLLFDRQPRTGGTPPTAADLEAWAVDAGADEGVVERALETADPAFVDAARVAARAAGVAAVPTVVVDGRPLTRATGIALADNLQRRILED